MLKCLPHSKQSAPALVTSVCSHLRSLPARLAHVELHHFLSGRMAWNFPPQDLHNRSYMGGLST
jgi:hypothetical protein